MNFENTSNRDKFAVKLLQFSPSSSSRHKIKLLVSFWYRIIIFWDGQCAVWKISTNILHQSAMWNMTLVPSKLQGVTSHKTVAVRPPNIPRFHSLLQSMDLLKFKNQCSIIPHFSSKRVYCRLLAAHDPWPRHWASARKSPVPRPDRAPYTSFPSPLTKPKLCVREE